MKINKLFGVKSITNLIYGCLLMIPFVSILSRVIYVQANPNAKESYSSESIYKSIAITANETMNTDILYNIRYKESTQHDISFNVKYISLTAEQIGVSQETYDKLTQIQLLANNNVFFYFTDTAKTLTNFFNEDFSINIILSSQKTLNLNDTNKVYVIETILTQNKLDNAFEYSLKTFTDENNVGSIDFFGWFTNLFLNQDNPHNQIYLGFANWYMNYTLLVSSGYLLFFALLWFVNYVRRILEKSSYHDFGGF